MSATPIPHLALIIYGDLVSIIDKMPPDQRVDTYVVGEEIRPALKFIRRLVSEAAGVYRLSR